MGKLILCFALVAIAAEVQGQTKAPAQYLVQIRMLESGAQPTHKESKYTLLLQAEAKGTLNASYRIPYYSSTKGEAKELHTVALGSIFECVARDAEGAVRLDCGFESSFVSKKQNSIPPIGFPPLIQSRQARTAATVPFGAEVLMADLDDPTTGNRLQFFISAERFNVSGPEKMSR